MVSEEGAGMSDGDCYPARQGAGTFLATEKEGTEVLIESPADGESEPAAPAVEVLVVLFLSGDAADFGPRSMSNRNFIEPDQIKTIEELENEVNKVLFEIDPGAVRMICAAVVANRMETDPVWLMLVASSSGGKGELLSAIEDLEFVHPLTDLTVNTFASGLKRGDKQTSLLLQIGSGILTFKEFTTFLSKNSQAREEIVGQLRAIFDGAYDKGTGTGDNINWRGKMGVLAGSTEVVYSYMQQFSAMGDRFIMYCMKQPDRISAAKRALENSSEMAAYRLHLKACFTSFLGRVITEGDLSEVTIDEETRDDILAVTNFATLARSGVMTDFKSGLVDFVPSTEMPARLTSQLYGLAAGFIALNRYSWLSKSGLGVYDEKLTPFEKGLIIKTALDSIPRTRRDPLLKLARYKQVSTAGLATVLNLPSGAVSKQLASINALGICKRFKKGGNQGDYWEMKMEWREILGKHQGITLTEDILEAEKVGDFSEEEDFDSFFDGFEKINDEDLGSLDADI